jgi:hypothetical protein
MGALSRSLPSPDRRMGPGKRGNEKRRGDPALIASGSFRCEVALVRPAVWPGVEQENDR